MLNNELLQKAIDNARTDDDFDAYVVHKCLMPHIDIVCGASIHQFSTTVRPLLIDKFSMLSDDNEVLTALSNVLHFNTVDIPFDLSPFEQINFLIDAINRFTQFEVE